MGAVLGFSGVALWFLLALVFARHLVRFVRFVAELRGAHNTVLEGDFLLWFYRAIASMGLTLSGAVAVAALTRLLLG